MVAGLNDAEGCGTEESCQARRVGKVDCVHLEFIAQKQGGPSTAFLLSVLFENQLGSSQALLQPLSAQVYI